MNATKISMKWLSAFRDRKFIIFIILFLGLILRICFLGVFGGFDDKLYDSLYDQNIYIDIALNLAQGNGFVTSNEIWIADPYVPTSIVTPIYPLFLAMIWSIFGFSLTSVRLIQTLLSLIIPFVTYDLARRFFSQKVGIIAGFLAAVNPVSIMYVRPIMTEGLFIPILNIVIYILYFLTSNKRHVGLYVLFWFLFSLLCMIRNECFVLLVLMCLYLFLLKVTKNSNVEWKKLLISSFTLILVFTPYCLNNYQTQGRFSPVRNSKWAMWDHTWMKEMRNHPEWKDIKLPERILVPDWNNKTEVERDNFLYKISIEFIKENPRIFLIQRIKNVLCAYPIIPIELIPPPIGNHGLYSRPDGADFSPTSLDDVVHYVSSAEIIRLYFFRIILILSIPAIFTILKNRNWPSTIVIIIVLWNVLYTFLLCGKERYRIPIDSFLIILASVSIVNFMRNNNP